MPHVSHVNKCAGKERTSDDEAHKIPHTKSDRQKRCEVYNRTINRRRLVPLINSIMSNTIELPIRPLSGVPACLSEPSEIFDIFLTQLYSVDSNSSARATTLLLSNTAFWSAKAHNHECVSTLSTMDKLLCFTFDLVRNHVAGQYPAYWEEELPSAIQLQLSAILRLMDPVTEDGHVSLDALAIAMSLFEIIGDCAHSTQVKFFDSDGAPRMCSKHAEQINNPGSGVSAEADEFWAVLMEIGVTCGWLYEVLADVMKYLQLKRVRRMRNLSGHTGEFLCRTTISCFENF